MKRDRAKYRPIPQGAIKIDLPEAYQTKDYTCGPAALLAVFNYFGVGQEDEADVEDATGMTKAGADPADLVRAATKAKLKTVVHRDMTDAALEAALRRRHPVLLTLQAWSESKRPRYATDRDDGHWVVAIGFAGDRFYFEDPSVSGVRAFLSRRELAERWHDIEGLGRKTHDIVRVGVEIWKPGFSRSSWRRIARHMD